MEKQYIYLSQAEKDQAGREIWDQLTTAAGSSDFRLGWAGMSMAEALEQQAGSGRMVQQENGRFALSAPDLQSLLALVEYPPSPDEYMSSADHDDDVDDDDPDLDNDPDDYGPEDYPDFDGDDDQDDY